MSRPSAEFSHPKAVHRGSYRRRVADLKPAYLLHGDDAVKLDAWRSRVRARAEASKRPRSRSSTAARAAPREVAAALSALTFATGDRYLLADGVESWKAGALDPLEAALASPPPDTVLVLIARPGARRQTADEAARRSGRGGRRRAARVRRAEAVGVAQVGRRAGARAGAEARCRRVRALVAIVGPHQRRLARELEKLALACTRNARSAWPTSS